MNVRSRFFVSLLILFYAFGPLSIAFAAAPPPTCQLYANPSTIGVGGAVTLNWSSTDATGGAITGVGNVGPSGSQNVLPSSAVYTTYVGSFTGAGGTANCQATVTVNTAISGSGASGTLSPIMTGNSVQTQTAPVTLPAGGTASGGLVPCGAISNAGLNNDTYAYAATACRACDLAALIQNIINFCIGLSIPIAAGLFAYAGILGFTSGANEHNLTTAKKIFGNAFVGFLIVITAWLVVNTVLHALLDKGQVFNTGNWFTIQCGADTTRLREARVNDLISSLPGINGSTPSTGPGGSGSNGLVSGSPTLTNGTANNNFAISSDGNFTSIGPGVICPSGYFYLPDAQSCTNEAGDIKDPTPFTTSGNVSGLNTGGWGQNSAASALAGTQQWVGQLQSLCANSPDPNCAQNTQAIMAIECNGKNCPVNSAGAVGLMQAYGPTACDIDGTIPGCSTCRNKTDIQSGGCGQVFSALTNTDLNLNIGVQEWNNCYSRAGGDAQLAAACYNGGPGAIQTSKMCGGGYAFQCTANPNKSWTNETVPYVGRFTLTKSLIQ